MAHSSFITIHQLDYTTATGQSIFRDINLALSARKIGIVGRNGIGKSTLFKLILNEVAPTAGHVQCAGTIAYCPQILNPSITTVAELFNLQNQLIALENILQGSIETTDYLILGENWDIKQNLQNHLTTFGLGEIDFLRPMNTLSGGEITRLLLAKTFLTAADIILLDEPTNNLDKQAKKLIYQVLQQTDKQLIIISHDRTLLNSMEQIVELTPLGIKAYGGNYDHYLQQKTIAVEAAKHHIKARAEQLDKTKQLIQLRKERHEKNEAKGARRKKAQIQAKGSYDKIVLKSAQGRSEQTNRRIRLQADRKLNQAETQLKSAKENLEISEEIKLTLPATQVPTNKLIIDLEDITYSYFNHQKPIIKNFNLKIVGPQRIALCGANGGGKTTLIKLILGQLIPQKGQILVGTHAISYLDQTCNILNPELTILENFARLNPAHSVTECQRCLANFLFKNKAALKLVKELSAGEKLRALLACILMSKQAPQLLILDEPTNFLDVDSINKIEEILNCYQGALIVISHDEYFLDKLAISRMIHAPFLA